MDKNTVILSVEDYNELRDFKENANNGKTLITIRAYGFSGENIYREFYTDNEIIEQLSKSNNELKKELFEINNIARMNCYEFRKWRKKYRK
jgi:hypothetical protein